MQALWVSLPPWQDSQQNLPPLPTTTCSGTFSSVWQICTSMRISRVTWGVGGQGGARTHT